MARLVLNERAMRLKSSLFLVLFLSLASASSACALADDHCSGENHVASTTPPLAGAALDQWNHTSCSTDEDSICVRGMPYGNELELCSHEATVLTTPAGPFMSLRCHYYSTDSSCHSSSSSHDPD
jgi:hypothetical protein